MQLRNPIERLLAAYKNFMSSAKHEYGPTKNKDNKLNPNACELNAVRILAKRTAQQVVQRENPEISNGELDAVVPEISPEFEASVLQDPNIKENCEVSERNFPFIQFVVELVDYWGCWRRRVEEVQLQDSSAKSKIEKNSESNLLFAIWRIYDHSTCKKHRPDSPDAWKRLAKGELLHTVSAFEGIPISNSNFGTTSNSDTISVSESDSLSLSHSESHHRKILGYSNAGDVILPLSLEHRTEDFERIEREVRDRLGPEVAVNFRLPLIYPDNEAKDPDYQAKRFKKREMKVEEHIEEIQQTWPLSLRRALVELYWRDFEYYKETRNMLLFDCDESCDRQSRESVEAREFEDETEIMN